MSDGTPPMSPPATNPYAAPEPGPYGAPAAPPPNNGKAIAALVLGIGGCCVPYIGFILAIVAVILGFIARKEIRQSNGAQRGDGMAIAGIVLGFVALALGLIVVIFFGAILAACIDDPESPECQELAGSEAQGANDAPIVPWTAPAVALTPLLLVPRRVHAAT